MTEFSDYFPSSKPIIGMIHLPTLPGYPDSQGIEHAVRRAVADLRVLEDGGVDGVLIENEYDRPHRVKATPETIAAMTRITRAVIQERESTVVGCEILLNDPQASLAVAHMAGADFIRTDYFVDRMTRTEYGEFDIDPAGLQAYRSALGADRVLILADIQVKYAAMIEPRPLEESARQARIHGADAIIITGDETGDAPTRDHLRQSAGWNLPVLIGSGMRADNAQALLDECDGAIVGTALMTNQSVDADKLELLLSHINR